MRSSLACTSHPPVPPPTIKSAAQTPTTSRPPSDQKEHSKQLAAKEAVLVKGPNGQWQLVTLRRLDQHARQVQRGGGGAGGGGGRMMWVRRRGRAASGYSSNPFMAKGDSAAPSRTINQSITFKVHGEPAGVSWDWAGGEGCVSGVHSIGRGTVRCGRRLAGPARPVGWKLRAGISLRSGCGGWCRGGIEKEVCHVFFGYSFQPTHRLSFTFPIPCLS